MNYVLAALVFAAPAPVYKQKPRPEIIGKKWWIQVDKEPILDIVTFHKGGIAIIESGNGYGLWRTEEVQWTLDKNRLTFGDWAVELEPNLMHGKMISKLASGKLTLHKGYIDAR